MCLHQNLKRRMRELRTSKSCIVEESIRQGSVSADFEDRMESAIFVDHIGKFRGIEERRVGLYQRERLGSKLPFKLGSFLLFQKL
jgi:hypothetical protein